MIYDKTTKVFLLYMVVEELWTEMTLLTESKQKCRRHPKIKIALLFLILNFVLFYTYLYAEKYTAETTLHISVKLRSNHATEFTCKELETHLRNYIKHKLFCFLFTSLKWH